MADSLRVVGLEPDGSVPVTIVSGGGTGGTASSFGSAFPPTGTAAGFIDASGHMAGATLSAAGNLKVDVAEGSGGNSAASATGSAVPASADYQGVNVGGTLRGVTGTNPSGTIFAQHVTGAGTAGTADAGVQTIQGIASMTPVQVSQATAASLNATVVGTGTLAVQNTAATPAGTNLIGKVAASAETSTVYNGTTALTPTFAKIAVSSSGDNTLISADATHKIRVLAYNFIANGTVNAKFQSGASGTDLTGLKYCVANMGLVAPFCPVGWFETASNTLLNLNLSAGVAVGGELVYVLV